ncbi:MAG: SAM-dependent chlorinase/fluorinase [Deltaproteobacteria bacterium]|nr:SAM-dependent chlorinase/fluorinase [Deltaproteobacteria bacterium]
MQFANIITLTTDFGLEDPYVGQLKGAILKHNISVRIIDICHSIPAHDILTAAVTIRTSYNYFPKGSIHLVIVDPGVGSQRRILAATAGKDLFIAPDNGALSLLFKDNMIQTVHRVENASLFPSEISSTFHGRDIMAPVAAAMAGGMHLNKVGPVAEINSCTHLDLPEPTISGTGIKGQVLHVDRFGNIRTNITTADLSKFQPASFSGIRIKSHKVGNISNTYSDSPSGSLVAVIDSAGYLEIAVNRGSAARLTECCIGDPLVVLMEGS